LASMLVVKNMLAADGIHDISDVQRLGLQVCAVSKIAKAMETQGILGLDDVVISESRSEVMEGVEQGLCAAAVLRTEDYDQSRSSGSFCNIQRVGKDVIFVWNVGVPVSARFHRAIQQGFIRKTIDGTWLSAEAKYTPTDVCGAADADEEAESFRVIDMAGPFIFTGAIILATFLERARSLNKRLQGADGDNNDPVETEGDNHPAETSKEAPGRTIVQMAEELSALAAELSRKAQHDDSVPPTPTSQSDGMRGSSTFPSQPPTASSQALAWLDN